MNASPWNGRTGERARDHQAKGATVHGRDRTALVVIDMINTYDHDDAEGGAVQRPHHPRERSHPGPSLRRMLR